MPRKIERLVITSEGRDKGKTFVLTEMPADQGERLANRIVFALLNTGAAIPEEALGAGWAALAALGLEAIGMLKAEVVQGILADAWASCVLYEHSPKNPLQFIVEGVNSQIEEVKTRYEIHLALWKLHTGFSLPVAPPTSGQASTSGEGTRTGWLSSMSRGLLQLLSLEKWRP
jgi:hypothetical protein